jgi:magnesium transporter
MPPAEPAPAPTPVLGDATDHATDRVAIATANDTAGSVRERLAGAQLDCADDVVVLDGRRLLGLVPIELLLGARADVAVSELMDADPPVVAPGTDQEVVAWEMVRRGESSVAVVDGDGAFRGLVPPHRLVAVLLTEHDEDMARLGGYLASTRRARTAAEERVARRLLHRLPWLLLGLLGAMASAALVAAYEEVLDRRVLLAFFVPGIVYMAAAVGTQTETLLIRGLSVGASLRGFALRELVTGIVIGGVIGLAFFAFALVVWNEADVALAVALALWASASVATVIAVALPWSLQRAGLDPAFGSGPLATVVQDLLSIAIYLAIATSIAA